MRRAGDDQLGMDKSSSNDSGDDERSAILVARFVMHNSNKMSLIRSSMLANAARTLCRLSIAAIATPPFELNDLRRAWVGRQRQLVAFDNRRRHKAPTEEVATGEVDSAKLGRR